MQWDRENDETGQLKPDMPQEGPREPEERPGVIWEEDVRPAIISEPAPQDEFASVLDSAEGGGLLAGHSETGAGSGLPAEGQYTGAGREPTPSDVQESLTEPPRRQFMKKAVAVCMGGAVMGIPAAAGLLAYTDPLRRKSAEGQFIEIAPLDLVPTDGTPVMFRVIADRADAWNRQEDVPIGKVYVKRTGSDVVVFNAICPHAGCNVDARADGSFLCPCHNSGFNPDGSMAANSVSPRALDTLEVDAEALKQGVVKVKFQNFRAATHDKISV